MHLAAAMDGFTVSFSITAAERSELLSTFLSGGGLAAVVLAVALTAGLSFNACRRCQSTLAPAAKTHLTLFWWLEVVVRLAVVATLLLYVIW